MKTRISRRVVAFCLLVLTAGVGLNSCNPPLESPSVGTADFSSIRIMNFAECDRPFDLFIYQEGSLDTVINRALPYGVGSAYATNLLPGKYTIQLTHVNRRESILAFTTVEVSNRAQKTVILWKNDADPKYELKEQQPDHPTAPDGGTVYIRFLNTKPSVGNVRLALDNPLNDVEDAQFADVAPRALTGYVPLKHSLDTAYALYLTRPGDLGKYEVVSRLAGASFAPGSFYTVVFGGNDDACRDTAAEKADTLRIRYFDDNEAGNELTFPVQQSLRFNFVNGLITPPVLAENQRSYEKVGVVLNNDDRYLISEMSAKEVSPVIGTEGEGDRQIFQTGFYTIPWTDAILVSMYKKDGLTGNSRGTKLVDARVGNRKLVLSDQPFSIVIMDTVSNTVSNGFPAIDSSKVRTWAVPLPVVAHPDSVTLVLVNGLARFKIQPIRAGTEAKFTINGTVPSFWNTPQPHEKYSYYSIHKDELSGGNIDVRVDVGRSTPPVNTLTKSFTAEPGGVYEIVIVGQRENTTPHGAPELRVLHTNPKRSQ